MKIRRLMIAAPKSGSGKTTITCALLEACKERGENVYAYKCGPDYIDPMFHEHVIGISSYNLDTFFTGKEETIDLFLRERQTGDLAIMEGVMGLYDGLGGTKEEGSSYHLASITNTPIVLVVDGKGMGRSIVALIAGFLQFDVNHLICGVILNKVSASYYTILKPLIESELAVHVFGYVPEEKERTIPSRHLGLFMPDEIPQLKQWLKQKAYEFEQTVSVPELLSFAKEAIPLDKNRQEEDCQEKSVTLGVAKDAAFCFYYKENLQLLEQYGARIRYFSPLHDEALPDECDGILLGGGYPEMYAKELSANSSMRKSIREAFSSKMPFVAECGGFLYLHDMLEGKDGCAYPQVGIFKEKAFDMKKLVRFGYIELEAKSNAFLPEGEKIKGHEFHYYESEKNGDGFQARKPSTNRKYDCIRTGSHYAVGFPHLYYPSNPLFAKVFVNKMSMYHCKRNGL